MPGAVLDHLVVVAPTLDAGEEFLRQRLGISMLPGGCHPRMGTHNRLLRVGPVSYLEVIAIDPQAEPPGQPRWFALDALPTDAPPRLATWVARTSDIETSAPHLSMGPIATMTRGTLTWRLTIPADGSLPFGGLCPHLIQWYAPVHPAATLPESGCRLTALELHVPEDALLERLLAAIGFQGPVRVHPTGTAAELVAHFATPQGPRTLRSSDSPVV